MTKMRTDVIAPTCFLIVSAFCVVELSEQIENGKSCGVDLEQERALRLQAEEIEMKLINEVSRDSIDRAYDALQDCEDEGPSNRYPEECGECWNAWAMDMAGSCDAVWDDYVNAMVYDCESQNLKTREEREECLGPAAHHEDIKHAFEAMSIHQESRAIP